MNPGTTDDLRWAWRFPTDGLFSSHSSWSSGRPCSSRGLAARWKGVTAVRMQLTHCCLWNTSLACSVWDWPGEGSRKRTLKMFLADGRKKESRLRKRSCSLKDSFCVYVTHTLLKTASSQRSLTNSILCQYMTGGWFNSQNS